MKDNMTYIEREAFRVVREELMDPDFMTTCLNGADCPCVQHRFALIEKLYNNMLDQNTKLSDEYNGLLDAHDNTFGHSREDYMQKSEIADLKDELKDANEIIDDLNNENDKLSEELEDTNEQLSRRSRPHEYEDERDYYPDGSDAPIRDDGKLPWSQPEDCDCADDVECTCDDCESEAQKAQNIWDKDIRAGADDWYRKVCDKIEGRHTDNLVKSVTWQQVTIGGVYDADEDEDMWMRTITYVDGRTERDMFEHGPNTDNDNAVR